MDYLWIGAGVAALWLWKEAVRGAVRHRACNVVSGLIALYFVNHFGAVIGLHAVPITWITGIIMGIVGLPGVAAVTLYYTFI